MENFFYNPWIVGIGVAIIAGLILHYILGVGKKSKTIKEEELTGKRIGILNEGKNNSFINNTFEGLDISIKDKGKNTNAKGNKFL